MPFPQHGVRLLGPVFLACGLANGPVQGAIIHTTSAGFMSAISGADAVIDERFETHAPGTVVPSGGSLGGLGFSYGLGSVQLAVTDGARFGGGGPFSTTSGSGFLGTTDHDLIQDGDEFGLSFPSVNAIGLYFISADTLFDGDISLVAGGVTASLAAADVEAVLSDGSRAWFLGIVDTVAEFTTAQITTIGGGFFLYNVDDLVAARFSTAAISAPPAAALIAGALPLLGWLRQRTATRRAA